MRKVNTGAGQTPYAMQFWLKVKAFFLPFCFFLKWLCCIVKWYTSPLSLSQQHHPTSENSSFPPCEGWDFIMTGKNSSSGGYQSPESHRPGPTANGWLERMQFWYQPHRLTALFLPMLCPDITTVRMRYRPIGTQDCWADMSGMEMVLGLVSQQCA